MTMDRQHGLEKEVAGEAYLTVIGFAGGDPEVKFLPNGDAVVNVSVAMTARKKHGDEWVDGETTWYRVTQFGKKAEAFADNAKKGDLIIAHGAFSMNTYEKDGQTRSIPTLKAQEVGIVPRAKKQQQEPTGGNDPW